MHRNVQKYVVNQELPNVGLAGVTLVNFGEYQGYNWFLADNDYVGITNGYVIINPAQKGFDYGNHYENSNIECHGGITFDEMDDEGNRVIGFDTAHPDDYMPYFDKNPYLKEHGHAWSTDELKQQCFLIINQLKRKRLNEVD